MRGDGSARTTTPASAAAKSAAFYGRDMFLCNDIKRNGAIARCYSMSATMKAKMIRVRMTTDDTILSARQIQNKL